VGSATLQVSVADVANADPFAMFFQGGRNLVLKTNPVQITVDSLPDAGRPAGFSGAVGSYRIAASLDRENVEAGRPVTLSVEISGRGLVKSLREPAWPDMPSMRRYETISSMNVSNTGDAIQGSKTFKVILIPQSTGRITIPPVSYPVFNPGTRKYAILRTAPASLTVKPGAAMQAGRAFGASGAPGAMPAGVKEIERDIRFLKTGGEGRRPRLPALSTAAFLGIQALPAAFFFLGISAAWRRRKLLGDPAGTRARRAGRDADVRLKRAAASTASGDASGFHLGLKETIVNYLADRWGISAAGLTLLEALRRLEERHLPAETVKSVREIWEEADLIRYAPAAAASANAEQRLDEARSLIRELERKL
jgi:hypothetical protein